MNEVEGYIMLTENDNQREIMLFFHQLFSMYPMVSSKIRFKVPFYDQKNGSVISVK
jgi:hypothetical protein